jgi:hypothetical protein
VPGPLIQEKNRKVTKAMAGAYNKRKKAILMNPTGVG